MKVGGICGECHKYYDGQSCPRCITSTANQTLNVIMDIPEHYNRGLGQVIRGRAEYRIVLREKGMVEIGNEKKYVDPERGRKNKEQEMDKQLAEVRPIAYKILNQYDGRSQWN